MNRRGERRCTQKNVGDVRVISQYARTENAHCEEVTAQISISAKNASDCIVAVFFLRYVDGERVRSVMGRMQRWGADELPFLATMFRSVLDASMRALRNMICYVVDEDNRASTLSLSCTVYDTTPRHLLVGIGLHKAPCIRILSG
jgi:hypothetical protein